MSSSRLNNVILTGSIIVYISVILFGLDGDAAHGDHFNLCQVKLVN